MLKSYKYRIYPNDEQREMIEKHFGCCRFVYNWALNEKITAWEERKESLSCSSLIKRLPGELKEQYPFLKEVTALSLQEAIRNLDTAYSNFFRNTGGFPKFKSRKNEQSVQFIQNASVDFEAGIINLPKTRGIRCIFDRRFDGVMKTVTLRRNCAGRYFVSVLVKNDEKEKPCRPVNPATSIGIDLGLKELAVCSNGWIFENIEMTERQQKRLKMLRRRIDRKKKGSRNREKARLRMARYMEKLRNRRDDRLHKASHTLATSTKIKTIFIEDLTFSAMASKKGIAKRLHNIALGSFLKMLSYKCQWNGVNLIKVGKYYPSSKTCHVCGFKLSHLSIDTRRWKCPECGTEHDRDINAAINIKNEGLRITLKK